MGSRSIFPSPQIRVAASVTIILSRPFSTIENATDNDSDEFQWAGGSGGVIESFKYEAAKGLYFKTRFKVSDATQSDFAVGLIITDTAFIDGTTDGIFFRKAGC